MKIILGCSAVVITTYYSSSSAVKVLCALQGWVCFIHSFSSSYLTPLQLKARVQVSVVASSTHPCTNNPVSLKWDGPCMLAKRYCFPFELGFIQCSPLHVILVINFSQD